MKNQLLMLGIDETSIFENPQSLAHSIEQRHIMRHEFYNIF